MTNTKETNPFKEIDERNGLREAGGRLTYQGYKITIVEGNKDDRTPAWIDIDARTGEHVIFISDQVPNYLYIPVLEQTIYDFNRRMSGEKGGDFATLFEVGQEAARRLGVEEKFSRFAGYWRERSEQQ